MRAWYCLLSVGLLAACSKGEGGGSAGAVASASPVSPESASVAWPAVSIPPLSEDRTLDASRQHGAYKANADRRIRLTDARIAQVEGLVLGGKVTAAQLVAIRDARQKLDLSFHRVEGATDAAWPAATAEFDGIDRNLSALIDAALGVSPRP